MKMNRIWLKSEPFQLSQLDWQTGIFYFCCNNLFCSLHDSVCQDQEMFLTFSIFHCIWYTKLHTLMSCINDLHNHTWSPFALLPNTSHLSSPVCLLRSPTRDNWRKKMKMKFCKIPQNFYSGARSRPHPSKDTAHVDREGLVLRRIQSMNLDTTFVSLVWCIKLRGFFHRPWIK